MTDGFTPALAALLEERFGPAVDTPVPLTAGAAAWFLLLWQPVLIVVVVAAGSESLSKRWRQGRLKKQAELAAALSDDQAKAEPD